VAEVEVGGREGGRGEEKEGGELREQWAETQVDDDVTQGSTLEVEGRGRVEEGEEGSGGEEEEGVVVGARGDGGGGEGRVGGRYDARRGMQGFDTFLLI